MYGNLIVGNSGSGNSRVYDMIWPALTGRLSAALILLLSAMQIHCGGPVAETVVLEEPMPAEPVVEIVRPVHFDRSLPYPVSIPEFIPDTTIIQPGFDRTFSLRLAVDSVGDVTGLAAAYADDSAIVAGYTTYLKSIKFKPGQIRSVDAPFWLAMTIDVGPAEVRPQLRFPLAADGHVADADLYFESLTLNGVELPAITLFPKYACDLKKGDTASVFPYIIFKLELDETGSITSVETLITTYLRFTEQLQTAIYWGEYSPLRIDGQAMASTNYLIVSFFPTSTYPTRALPISEDSSGSIYDVVRVRLVADTIGLLNKPVPRGRWTGTLAYGLAPYLDQGPASILVRVDALGVARVTRISPKAYFVSPTRWDLLAQRILMYPARDFHGRNTEYRGRFRVEYVADTIIRIQPEWLQEAPFNPSH